MNSRKTAKNLRHEMEEREISTETRRQTTPTKLKRKALQNMQGKNNLSWNGHLLQEQINKRKPSFINMYNLCT